ncbi:hypothetical protein B566_EDAN009486 [Ephemera danica]|nr:hypothetical protein B566_EDAN009486 [Ephemera danica]
MGNSQGSPKEDIVYDSRVIKISESVAKRIFVNPNEPTPDSPRKKSSSGTAGFIDDPPIPRQHQPFREDGNYVDDSFFEWTPDASDLSSLNDARRADGKRNSTRKSQQHSAAHYCHLPLGLSANRRRRANLAVA